MFGSSICYLHMQLAVLSKEVIDDWMSGDEKCNFRAERRDRKCLGMENVDPVL